VAGPFPLATLAPTITAAGISAPSFSDILSSLQASAQAIFGTDISLDPDDQDGQLLGVFALAQKTTNDSVIAAYNSYSPSSAIGSGLSSVVKINGIRRLSPTNSTAIIQIVGQAGTLISGGILNDPSNNQWALPSVVTIPYIGVVYVTATCQTSVSIAAPVNTIGNPSGGGSILNPTPGWQTATNPDPAILGAPVETDAQLRIRQTKSTGLPAQTTREAILASILEIQGVTSAVVFQNDGNVPDLNSLPPHSVAAVVAGGDATAIATAIALKKGVAGTYGSTQVIVLDSQGVPDTINFFELDTSQVYVHVTVQPLLGYQATTGNLIASAITTFVNALGAGGTVYQPRLFGPADLTGDAATSSSGLTQTALDALSGTYVVRSLTLGTSPSVLLVQDISVPFYSAPFCGVGNVTITIQT